MPVIPKNQQHYPVVPIYELTDLYSAGLNTLADNRAFIASHLPKTLRLSEANPFNNIYTLFVEDTPIVNSIVWTYQLYNNGEPVAIANYIAEIPTGDHSRYSLFFSKDSIDALGVPVADKLKITCRVQLAVEEIELTVEHDIVQLLDTEALNVEGDEEEQKRTAPHQGNPQTTKYILNHLGDYLPLGSINWNNNLIEADESEGKENNLLKIVCGIIYYTIQVSQNDTRGFDFLYNVDQGRNKGVEAFLNEDKKNKGDYTNGLCKIPLNILNEILIDIENAPSFSDIDENHAILTILQERNKSNMQEKIQETQNKLEEDIDRYVALFNLTLFPKSSIKLCAIVFKYLLELSKKNECNECKRKSSTWSDLTIDDLSENPKFVWNLLTHYFEGPVSKVKKFSKAAVKTKDLIWSPFVYAIVNNPPRIVKAYFAKRIVERLNNELIEGVDTPIYKYSFQRIDDKQIRIDENENPLVDQPEYDCILGRDVFLIVETLNARGKKLTINVKPTDRVFNGSTGNLTLASGIAQTYEVDIESIIGNTYDLAMNTLAGHNSSMDEYLNIDYKDKSIVKLRFKPENEPTFTAWATHLSTNTGSLMIEGKLSDETESYFGNDFNETAVLGEFLSNNDKYLSATFRIVNRVVFELYKDDNPWNFLPVLGGNRRLIGKVNNQFVLDIENGEPEEVIRKVLYFYYDELDYEHFFGEFDIERHPDWNQRNNPPPVDMIYTVQISSLQEYNHRNVHIDIDQTSVRDFANFECYAGLLAAMAVNNIHFLTTTGFSHADGSPAPSVSHFNGEKGDLRYLRTDRNGAACILTQPEFDFALQSSFNNSLFQYGWARLGSTHSENFTDAGGVQRILPHCTHLHTMRVDVNYSSEDVNVNQDFPQRITADPRAGALNVGDVISLAPPNGVIVAGVRYQVNNMNQREITGPLPQGATLQIGHRFGSPVRHNNHLHIGGFDHDLIYSYI